ncbi:hypothetical protein EJD96_20085 [Herbaspirillum seropedicae]|uniref:hypothetical protein n=1 Tax=Herbaspirillum seropedicae TaxID=964 RepID=UPI001120344F|nr:hypothetical protein [Herbaspirillum seropedicae]QDD66294.1 hypothetical protein EJD96_20085 [Herbaspirillum seropedicae]
MQRTPAFLFASAPATRADASRHRYKAIDAMQRNMAALLFLFGYRPLLFLSHIQKHRWRLRLPDIYLY